MKKQQAGNKILSKYNEFIVDKTLMKKIQSVKPTINNNNQFFEKKINNRKQGFQDTKSCKSKNSNQPSLAPTRPGTTEVVQAALEVLKNQTQIYENNIIEEEQYENFEEFIDPQKYIVQNDQFDNTSVLCNMDSPQNLQKNKGTFKNTNQNKYFN